MKKTINIILLSMLSGCAIYSYEIMVSTFMLEGGLDYYQIEKKTDEIYLYDVRIWEKAKSQGDLHSYESNTTELRKKTAKYILSHEAHTACESVDFLSESSYQDFQQEKAWLRGTWWSVKALCHRPARPRRNKFS